MLSLLSLSPLISNPCFTKMNKSDNTLFFFYKNIFYKNIEAEILKI